MVLEQNRYRSFSSNQPIDLNAPECEWSQPVDSAVAWLEVDASPLALGALWIGYVRQLM